MNTLEQLVIFVPSVLLFARYVNVYVAAALGGRVPHRAGVVFPGLRALAAGASHRLHADRDSESRAADRRDHRALVALSARA